MRKLWWKSLLVAAATALLLAGCGGDDNGDKKTTPAATTGGASQTVKVKEREYKIDPTTLKIEKAGRVTFDVRNEGTIVHALEIEAPGGEAQTGNIDPGQSKKVTVDLNKAGSYEWYCPIANHKDLGMEGEIRVAGGGSTTTEGGSTTTDTTETGGSRY
jgi:uncharacterized cupredoxin-like copper-binding protein